MKGAKLGRSVDPSQVRLQPGHVDGYTWKALPEKTHLFAKQLSKHSVGAYMELCRDVGVSFEAVPIHAAQPKPSHTKSEVTFSTRIEELLRDNQQLVQDLDEHRTRLLIETEKKQTTETALEQVKRELHKADVQIQGLTQHNVELISKEKCLKHRSEQCIRGIHEAMSTLRQVTVDELDRC